MHNTLALPKQVIELLAAHMANMEQQLVLERKYPDDVDDRDESKRICKEFDRLEQATVHNLYALADMLVQITHQERYTLHVEAQVAECDRRANEFEWHQHAAKMHERCVLEEVL